MGESPFSRPQVDRADRGVVPAQRRDHFRGSALFPFWERANVWHVRVFNRSTVTAVAGEHADVRQALFAWFAEVERANWSGPDDIKTLYPSASFLAGNRVVLNIRGNK